MAEYIDREKLGIGKCNPEVFEDKGYAKGWNAAIDVIQSIPAADVQPVRHGRWIEFKRVPVFNSSWESVYWKCSECGIEICTTLSKHELGKWHYCVKCGAKMDGEA